MKLRPYQERAIDFWLEKKRVYFAIDMGLGKTAIVLHTINQLNLPTLIVAPLKVAYNTWPDEITDWGLEYDLSIDVLHGPNKLQKFKRHAQIQVINYEGLPWLYKQLYDMFQAGKPMPYKVLVLDESTLAKDPETNRFGYLSAMRDMFEYIANLSGTPSPNSLLDLWAQYYILDRGEILGNDFRIYRNRFFKQDTYRKYQWDIRFGAENVIHKSVAPITFQLTASDHIHLPKRIYNTINVELHPAERKKYESFKKDFVLMLDGAQVESLNQASLSSKLRQFVQGFVYENCLDGRRNVHHIHDHKITALKHLIDTHGGKSILCFTQFQAEVDRLLKEFPGTPVIAGKTKQSDSNRYIKEWNEGKIPLLIAHPKSVSRGLNLQKGGHIAVWYALSWSLDDYLQANKRLHRPGQKETVVIHHIVIPGTIDDTVVQALQTKGMTQQRLLEFLRKETMKYAA